MRTFFSGAYPTKIRDMYISAGVQAVNISFFDCRQRSTQAVVERIRQYKDEGIAVLLTAGSRSFLKDKKFTNQEINNFHARYVELVEEVYEDIEAFAELDLQDLIDPIRVYEWRDNWLEKKFEDKLIVGYREEINEDSLREYEIFDYIGVDLEDLPKFLELSDFKERKVRFHVWDGNKAKLLRASPLYSMGLFAPLLGGYSKVLYDYRGTLNLKWLCDISYSDARREKVRQKLVPKVVEAGLDKHRFMAEDYQMLNHWNLLQWKQYLDDVEEAMPTPYWAQGDVALQKAEPVAMINPSESTALANTSLMADPRLAVKRQCNTCAVRAQCPMFKADSDCRLDHVQPINNIQDVSAAYNRLIALSENRLQHALLEERLLGNNSEEVTAQIEGHARIMEGALKAEKAAASVKIEASGSEGVGALTALLAGVTVRQANRGASPVERRARLHARAQDIADSMQDTDEIIESTIIDAEFKEVEKDEDE